MLKIINPYPGFENGFYRPYTEDEHELFYGREKDISTLKLKLRQRRLISLVADRKMGKTSILRAGLIPNLRNFPFDGYNGNEWKCVYMMPEQNPILSLAKALVNPLNKISEKITPSMEEEVFNQLKKNDYGLVRVIESIIGDRNINILLAIDDFIDVFEKNVEQKEKIQFLNLLYRIYAESSIPFFIVTSFNKEDFKDSRLRIEPKFYKALNMGIHKLNFLDDTGLRNAIDSPAKMVNSIVASDLSSEMMLMLLQDGDQLRKLQLLMSRTWHEWKINHKDKNVTKAHYFRATGQKSKAVAKGLMKGGSINVDHLESLAKESSRADNSEMAKLDYQKLSDKHKSLFKRIIPHLIDDSTKELKSIEIDRKMASDMIGVNLEELGILVTQIPTILAMDKKKLAVNDISIFNEWDEIKEWIRNSNSLKLKFEQIAEAAILHYIDGIDIQSVISRVQYKEQFKYVDFDLITRSWAMSQHEQFELGLDFIQKLQETYGKIDVQSKSSSVIKKMSFGVKKEDDSQDSDDNNDFMSSINQDSDEDSKLEAMKIMGLIDDSEKSKEVVKIKTSQATSDRIENRENQIDKNQESESQTQHNKQSAIVEIDDEDAAIQRLLSGNSNDYKSEEVGTYKSTNEENEENAENEDERELPDNKRRIELKPKIVLKAKTDNDSESPIKPKIIIKKK